jgi:hypothetical protein
MEKRIMNGVAAAAILAAGIGSLVLGVFVVLAEVSPVIKNTLNLYNPAGPLSGKTTYAVLVWLIAWMALHLSWRNKEVNFGKAFFWALVLVTLGFIGTFPPFFELFSVH